MARPLPLLCHLPESPLTCDMFVCPPHEILSPPRLEKLKPTAGVFLVFRNDYPIFIVALYLSTTIHAVTNINSAVRGSHDERET
jgi:hypothetical protein